MDGTDGGKFARTTARLVLPLVSFRSLKLAKPVYLHHIPNASPLAVSNRLATWRPSLADTAIVGYQGPEVGKRPVSPEIQYTRWVKKAVGVELTDYWGER